MINNLAFYAYSKSIWLKWSPPAFLPYFYVQTINCKLRFHSLPYVERTFTLERYATSSGIGLLKPDSECQIKIKAVYNPASIDPGIYMSVSTFPQCKLNQCKLQTVYSYICIGSLRLPVAPKLTFDCVLLLMYKCKFFHD